MIKILYFINLAALVFFMIWIIISPTLEKRINTFKLFCISLVTFALILAFVNGNIQKDIIYVAVLWAIQLFVLFSAIRKLIK